MSPKGTQLQSIPWTKDGETRSPLQHKSREKDSARSDLENKLLFEDVFKEKVIAKYDSYKNSLSKSRFGQYHS